MDQKKILKKRRGKTFGIFISPLVLVVVGFLSFKSSLPFRPEEIRPVRDFSFQPAQTVSQEELENLRVIFSQSFTFMEEGEQYYLFLSQNKEYILWFFKMRKLTPKYWLNYIPFPWLEQERLNKIGHRKRIKQELFGNFKIAFEDFRHMTNLHFIHFFSTLWLKSKVRAVDPEGVTHIIALDSVPFVLQKRAASLSEQIDSLMQEGKQKEAINSLLLILDLVKERCVRGLGTVVDSVEYNYGFVSNKAVFLNVEKMERDESLEHPLNMLREVFHVGSQISSWLEQKHPCLVLDFQKEFQEMISLLEES